MEEIYPNVFEAQKDKLISDFLKLLKEPRDMEKVENALHYIILDCSKLKLLNGSNHDILPFWARENREDRFDVKPIIIQNGKCIFSLVVIKQLRTSILNIN